MSQTTVTIKLPGLMSGATITTTGDFAVIHVWGIDSGIEVKKIFRAAAATSARKGTIFTGKVVHPGLLAKYEHLASTGKRQFRGRVTKIGPDEFRLDFDKLPLVK